MKNLITTVLGLCSILACSNDSQTPIGTLETSNNTQSGQELRSSLTLGQHSEVKNGGVRIHRSLIGHFWHIDSAKSVSAGTIYVNGQPLPRYAKDGHTWYQNKNVSDSVPIIVDGRHHVFTATGGPGYPAFTDSLHAPLNPTVINFPAPSDTLSISSGATITWGPVSTVDWVQIVIRDTTFSSQKKIIRKNVPSNSSSVTITSAELSDLKPGRIWVSVTRGNTTTGTAGPDQKYRLALYSSQEVWTWLKE